MRDIVQQNMHDCEALAREVIARCQTLARFSEDDGQHPPHLSVAAHARLPSRNCRMGRASRSDIASGCRRKSAHRLSAERNPELIAPATLADRLASRHRPQRWSLRRHSRSRSGHCAARRFPKHASFLSPFEVIGFSEEEGVRFGTPFIGSRALVGSLDEELLKPPGCARNFDTQGDRRILD